MTLPEQIPTRARGWLPKSKYPGRANRSRIARFEDGAVQKSFADGQVAPMIREYEACSEPMHWGLSVILTKLASGRVDTFGYESLGRCSLRSSGPEREGFRRALEPLHYCGAREVDG